MRKQPKKKNLTTFNRSKALSIVLSFNIAYICYSLANFFFFDLINVLLEIPVKGSTYLYE